MWAQTLNFLFNKFFHLLWVDELLWFLFHSVCVSKVGSSSILVHGVHCYWWSPETEMLDGVQRSYSHCEWRQIVVTVPGDWLADLPCNQLIRSPWSIYFNTWHSIYSFNIIPVKLWFVMVMTGTVGPNPSSFSLHSQPHFHMPLLAFVLLTHWSSEEGWDAIFKNLRVLKSTAHVKFKDRHDLRAI